MVSHVSTDVLEEYFPKALIYYFQLWVFPGGAVALFAGLAYWILLEPFVPAPWGLVAALASIPFFWALLVTIGFLVNFPRSVDRLFRTAAVAVGLAALAVELGTAIAWSTYASVVVPRGSYFVESGYLLTFASCNVLLIAGILLRKYEDYLRIGIVLVFTAGFAFFSTYIVGFTSMMVIGICELIMASVSIPFYALRIIRGSR